jgi:alkaline phosphatase
LVLAGAAVGKSVLAAGTEATAAVRVGLMTDLHYADKAAAGTRYYRDSILKVREAVGKFNSTGATMAVELGDFVDAAEEVATEVGYLEKIEAEYAKFQGDRHYVFGNHCVWSLTKAQFADHCGARAGHYSFDKNGFHFVALDACYRADGVAYGKKNYEWTDTEIPPAEREWLKGDLAGTKLKTIVFVHQRLDVANHYGVKSAPAVRGILEEAGNVLAVFQGHSHQNDLKRIGGIPYCTLAAVIEGTGVANSAYAVLDVFGDGSLRVDGYRQQTDYAWG